MASLLHGEAADITRLLGHLAAIAVQWAQLIEDVGVCGSAMHDSPFRTPDRQTVAE